MKRRNHRKHRARRHNPVPVILANPRRGRRRRRNPTRLKRRRRARARARVANPMRHMRRHRRRNPSKLHRRIRHRRRHNPGRLRFRRRRHNPGRVSMLMQGLKIGFFAMLGIGIARTGKFLYQEYVAPHVLGAGTGAPLKSIAGLGAAKGGGDARGMVNDFLQLVAMAGMTYGVEKGLKLARVGDQSRLYFKIGGYGETARHALGSVVRKLSPSTQLNRFGLDGMGAGQQYPFQLVPPVSMSGMGLEERSDFDGLGLEEDTSFEGMGCSPLDTRHSPMAVNGY